MGGVGRDEHGHGHGHGRGDERSEAEAGVGAEAEGCRYLHDAARAGLRHGVVGEPGINLLRK